LAIKITAFEEHSWDQLNLFAYNNNIATLGYFMTYSIYLSGEIHSNWREQIQVGLDGYDLDTKIYSPVTDHEDSDNVGADILGAEDNPFWKDHKAAKINALRTTTLIKRADFVVVRFGDKYRQWNAAFDAGLAIGLGKPLITLHGPELTHALKEVDGAALAVTETPQQVVDIIKYISQA
jgi:YtoQ family protein